MKKLVLLAVSAALIAGGCGKKDKVNEAANKVADKVEKTTDAAVNKAGETKDAVMDKASETKDAVMDKAGETKDAVMDKAGDMKDGYGSDSGHMDSKLSEADHALMMKSCMDDEKTKEVCGCALSAMNDGLSKETLGVLVQSTKVESADGPEAGQAYLENNLNQTQAMEFFGVMPKLMECDPSMAEGLQ